MFSSHIAAGGGVTGGTIVPAGEECTDVESMFSSQIAFRGGEGDELSAGSLPKGLPGPWR